MLVAQVAQETHELLGQRTHAALALHRLHQNGGGFLGHGRLHGLPVAERHLVEAFHLGTETLEILGLAAGGDGRQRAAVKGAFHGDDAVALGLSVDMEVAPRGLDRAFQRLGAGIGEEHLVGEGRPGQTLGEPGLARNFVDIGQVPQFVGLVLQRFDKVRMGVAERIDGDAGREIEIAFAGGGLQPHAMAALEHDRNAVVCVVQRLGVGHGAHLPNKLAVIGSSTEA